MGLFVVFEGIDGSGKTTLSHLWAAEEPVTRWMRFPNRDTFYGKLIDTWLQGWWEAAPGGPPHQANPVKDFRLLDAAVFQALQTVNRLEVAQDLYITRGTRTNIACDRYWPSGFAYGQADGLDGEMLTNLHQLLPQPDLFLLIDTPLEAAATRRATRLGVDVYEGRGREYMEKVQKHYHDLWGSRSILEPRRWVCIENDGTVEAAMEQVRRAVDNVRR